ncbi:MAG: hypothetical protein HWE18_02405 [Gammaproteobacteria bacterium]|nr:hypothetical protein [Gammaproteobacteria bacterium]
MDISLHSFILVVGLIVIGFIIWDGVKKVRAARANQLDQTLEGYDDLDALSNDDLPAFDDLEIKDELLQQALADSEEPVLIKEAEKAEQTVTQDDSALSPVFTVLEDDESFDDTSGVEVEADIQTASQAQVAPELTVEQDDLEHFSAQDDSIDYDDVIVATEQDHIVSSKRSAQSTFVKDDQDVLAQAVLSHAEVKSQHDATVTKKSQRASKEELAAQLAQARAEANQKAKPEAEEQATIEEIAIDDKEPVPVLMEPVELGQKVDPNPPKQHELVLPEFIQQTLEDEPVYAELDEPEIQSMKHDPLMEYIEDVQAMPVGEKLSEREAAQEIFVINILKQDGQRLMGRDLHHVFNVCDMRHGEMNIFHRFEKANAQGKIQFSVVNAIEPGTFDIHTIDELETPGISLFMSLPGPEKPMEAFDAMAEVALVFSRNFNASLHDDTHSDLTPQTLEHYRQRIREFTRKHLSQKK